MKRASGESATAHRQRQYGIVGCLRQRCRRSPSIIYFLGQFPPTPAEQCACAFPKGTTCQLVVSARAIVTDIMIRQRSTLLDDHLPTRGEEPSGRWRRQLAYQLARPRERGRRGCWAIYQARMDAGRGPRVDMVDMVGDGEGARPACMTSRHSSDLSHAGPSSWSVVASHWGSCEMGRPVTPMHAVRDGVWRRPTAPPEWTEGFAGPAS